eukprot:12428590-Karenia_brevis.AAC.2
MHGQLRIQCTHFGMNSSTKASACWPIALLHAFLRIELRTLQSIRSKIHGAAASMRGQEERGKTLQAGTLRKPAHDHSALYLIVGVTQINAYHHPVRVQLQQSPDSKQHQGDATWDADRGLLGPEVLGKSGLDVGHEC